MKIITKRMFSDILMFACLLLSLCVVLGTSPVTTPEERQDYEQDHSRVTSIRSSLLQSNVRDLSAYEAFADDLDEKWRERNREYHARLMLAICKPLSSGTFKEVRRYEMTRNYALSALEEADILPLTLELELIGHVTTVRIGPGASAGESFVTHRDMDVAVRLHAWKRLLEAIDSNWDPDEVLWGGNVAPPEATGLSPGVDPEAIKDANLRAEYEAAIQRNNQKIEEYQKQYELHKWLKRFPKRTENDIIQAYSHPPFDIEKLQKILDEHLPDQEAKARIIEAVDKSMREKQNEEQ